MSPKVEPLITINEIEAFPDDGKRYEIIEGELHVSAAPNLNHQRISGNLFEFIRVFLRQNPIGELIATSGAIFNDINYVIPDLVFISNDQREAIATGVNITGVPELIIEIVSSGSENEKRDRVVKKQLYGKYGVKEYWLVEPFRRVVEVYHLEGEALKLEATFTERDELVSSVLNGFQCKVENIFQF